jgi:hypothetical protein
MNEFQRNLTKSFQRLLVLNNWNQQSLKLIQTKSKNWFFNFVVLQTKILEEVSSPCGSNGDWRRRSKPAREGGAAFYRRPALANAVCESSLRHGRGVRRCAWPGTAATWLGGRRHGRHGVATARMTRGARRRGMDGSATQGAGPRRTDRQTEPGLGVRAQRAAARLSRSGAPRARTNST